MTEGRDYYYYYYLNPWETKTFVLRASDHCFKNKNAVFTVVSQPCLGEQVLKACYDEICLMEGKCIRWLVYFFDFSETIFECVHLNIRHVEVQNMPLVV